MSSLLAEMSNRVPQVTKFFGCIPLRVGALIIGYFTAVLSLALISIASVSIYKLKQYVSNNSEQQLQSTATGLYILHAFFILVFLFCCTINIVLVVGVHKNNHRLVWYYVPTTVVLVSLTLGLTVHSFFFLTLSRIWPLFVWSGILCYFIIVVNSLYLEMEAERRPVHRQRSEDVPLRAV